MNLNTNLQAVAVRITLSFVFTICSIYAPPSKCIDIRELQHLSSQIQGPVMLLGDFNAHNPLWGSDNLTPKGRVIETFTTQNDLCLFNDGSYTFLHSGNGSYSAIDLSFSSPDIFDRFSWEVHEDCCGSDHFPIVLRTLEDDNHIKPQRWKFKQADWLTLKRFALYNLIKILLSPMTQLLIFQQLCLRLLTKQYLNPRLFLNPENLGLMVNVNR